MTYVYDDVTYVVNALSARVTEGVPINTKHLDPDPMGSRIGDPEHCQSATRLQQGAPSCQHSARTEVEHQLEAIIASPHKDTGRMPLQLTRQQQLLRKSMRRERPARSARTALRPLPLPRRGRKRSGVSGSRTVMTLE